VTITPRGMTMVPEVTDVTVEEATTEAYEGVLVRLSDAVLTNATYDCSEDSGSCSDSELWEVSGSANEMARIVIFDRTYQDDDWTDQIGQTPVQGVLSYRFDRRRLLPRLSTDFTRP
jgi:hypothetical protein